MAIEFAPNAPALMPKARLCCALAKEPGPHATLPGTALFPAGGEQMYCAAAGVAPGNESIATTAKTTDRTSQPSRTTRRNITNPPQHKNATQKSQKHLRGYLNFAGQQRQQREAWEC
jgi:hypothetical protein